MLDRPGQIDHLPVGELEIRRSDGRVSKYAPHAPPWVQRLQAGHVADGSELARTLSVRRSGSNAYRSSIRERISLVSAPLASQPPSLRSRSTQPVRNWNVRVPAGSANGCSRSVGSASPGESSR